MSLFAIGDVHGCNLELQQLLEKLDIKSNDKVIFVGDYIDRGPDSKGVINTILELKKKHEVITLMGNHERMFLDWLNDNPDGDYFLQNGGYETVASYLGVPKIDLKTINSVFNRHERKKIIPPEHLTFFESLTLFHEEDNYFFVHASVPACNFEDMNNSFEEIFLWERCIPNFPYTKKIVHGHTPVKDICETLYDIDIDTGCVFGNKLSCIKFPEKEVFQVKRLK